MTHKIIIIITLFCSLFGLKAQDNEAYRILEVQTFKDSILNKEVQLIDVRTPEEYKTGYIEKAINIDFYSGKFTTEFNKLDKEKPVYIYCRSGSRSKKSALKLAKMGFKEIYDLKGGILNYD